MNVLFLTIGRMEGIETHSIYPDLLRQFRDNGHNVYVAASRERRTGLKTSVLEDHNVRILYVRIGNITKCNFVEKGISTILLERQYKSAIKKYFSNIKFDLILYSTPPITLAGVVQYVKKRDNAKTYLLLKDIFPQNAVDIGILSKKGLKGILYKYFRIKEKKLYGISDYIGCMSEANCKYVLRQNPEVSSSKVEVCPNCIEIQDVSLKEAERISMREKYGIPLDKIVYVYGGNLGKPQGIPFLIKCLKSQINSKRAFFLIVGDGTEYSKLETFFEKENPKNMKLLKRLPKDDYDRMIAACDVGMIFLDHRFTIPNFPSRLLSYMQAKLPVLAVTDPNTDIGKVIVEGGFGWWCESDDIDDFNKIVEVANKSECQSMGDRAWEYMKTNYTSERGYGIIFRQFSGKVQSYESVTD